MLSINQECHYLLINGEVCQREKELKHQACPHLKVPCILKVSRPINANATVVQSDAWKYAEKPKSKTRQCVCQLEPYTSRLAEQKLFRNIKGQVPIAENAGTWSTQGYANKQEGEQREGRTDWTTGRTGLPGMRAQPELPVSDNSTIASKEAAVA